MKNKGLDYATAFELVRASNVFTTHTPVPAGNDHFAPELVTNYLKSKADELGIGIEGLLALGRQNPGGQAGDLLHDRAGPAPEPLRQRRQRAARPRLARHVAAGLARRAGRGDPHLPRHQRHPHPQLALLGDRPAVRALPGLALVRGAHQPHDLGPHRQHPRRRAVALPRAHARAAGQLRPAAPAQAAAGPRRQPGLGAPGRRGAGPRGPDHRLRPPLRHLQAGAADPARPGPAEPAAQRSRSGRCS